MRTVSLKICNQRGLHARAAAKFVKLVAEFSADVTVSKDGQKVTGNSILGLMMLAATPGSEIVVESVGDQGEDALAALKDLVSSNFDED